MHVNRNNSRTASLGSDLLWKRDNHHGATDGVEDYSDMPGEYPENMWSPKRKDRLQISYIGAKKKICTQAKKKICTQTVGYMALHDMTPKVYSPN